MLNFMYYIASVVQQLKGFLNQ